METAHMMIAPRANVTETVRAVLRSLPSKNNETSLPALPFFLDSLHRDARVHVAVFRVGIGVFAHGAAIPSAPRGRHDGRRVHDRSWIASGNERRIGGMAKKVRPLSTRRKARFELRGTARRRDADLPGVLATACITDRGRIRLHIPHAVPAAAAHRRGDSIGCVGMDATTEKLEVRTEL